MVNLKIKNSLTSWNKCSLIKHQFGFVCLVSSGVIILHKSQYPVCHQLEMDPSSIEIDGKTLISRGT